MTEKLWQGQVEQIAELHGWRVYHAPDNRPVRAASGRTYVQKVNAGFPDLVLVKPPRLLMIELKTTTGRVSPEQKEWLRDLDQSGVEVAVWRPADLNQILRILGPRAEKAVLAVGDV